MCPLWCLSHQIHSCGCWGSTRGRGCRHQPGLRTLTEQHLSSCNRMVNYCAEPVSHSQSRTVYYTQPAAWIFGYYSILDSCELTNELKATQSNKNEDSSSFLALILGPLVPCCIGGPITQLITNLPSQHPLLTVYPANTYSGMPYYSHSYFNAKS